MSDPTGSPLDTILTGHRTHNAWQDRKVEDSVLETLYDAVRFGPTSANCSPARFIFVRSPEGKEKIAAAVSGGNHAKTISAPVTVIVAQDMKFYDHLPKLFPHTDARSWFTGSPRAVEETAMRNSSMQGAYFIMAARALGLDCGPMSGFDAAKVKEEFFADTDWEANFLINLGYGDESGLFDRLPRLSFDEACRLA